MSWLPRLIGHTLQKEELQRELAIRFSFYSPNAKLTGSPKALAFWESEWSDLLALILF